MDSIISKIIEKTIETISLMRKQEDTCYSSRGKQERNEQFDLQEMVARFLSISKSCNWSVETVEIAISYLDRFLNTDAGEKARKDKTVFQLAGITALYLATKRNEPRPMPLKGLVRCWYIPLKSWTIGSRGR